MKFDVQTERVYAAEDGDTICPIAMTEKTMGDFLHVVLNDPAWRKRWGKKKLKIVMRSPSARYARALIHRGCPVIILGASNAQRTVHIILHELAHLLVGGKHNHDVVFCRTLLRLVHDYAGTHYERKLRHRLWQTGALKRRDN